MTAILAEMAYNLLAGWHLFLVIALAVGWVAGLAAASGTTENDADFDQWERDVFHSSPIER